MTSKRKSRKQSVYSLPQLRANVAGVDLGSREHFVCAPNAPGEEPTVRRFGSTTPQLSALIDWLKAAGIESVAMESTGVYWITLYEMLEAAGIEPVLVNTRELKSVPGRKTDVLDCQWIQLLHSCGLLRGSFRPNESICGCRALTRQCANLVEERSKAVNWMQKALDQMNVQVHRAVTDITGKTGMAIIRAIVRGERNPEALAEMRDKRCRKSIAEIAEHLTGNWRDEHLFNLKMALRLYDELQIQIDTYEAELDRVLEDLTPRDRKEQSVPIHPNPHKEKAIRNRGEQSARTTYWRFANCDLTRIDGISSGATRTILTEIGLDLSAFESEKHFVSWLRLCPRHAISGGKTLRKKPNGTGSNRVAGVLRMAAVSLSNSKSALGAEFRRIARRKSGAVAVFAMARKLAVLVYRMLCHGQDYVDEGEAAYERRFERKRIKTLIKQAESLGYQLVEAS